MSIIKDAFSESQARKYKLHDSLLENIKTKLPELRECLKTDGNNTDEIYRYYHQSFKVYYLQEKTLRIVELLSSLATWEPVISGHNLMYKTEPTLMNHDFMKIISDGTGKKFDMAHNSEWDKHTRPIVEAHLHAKFFVEQLIKFGDKLETAPQILDSGWAAVLYLYNLR